ncbi:MAG: hypothetical protein Q9227_000618 [Pyrenula ochraceoflavens]
MRWSWRRQRKASLLLSRESPEPVSNATTPPIKFLGAKLKLNQVSVAGRGSLNVICQCIVYDIGTSNRGGSRQRKKNTSLTHIPIPSPSPLKHEFPQDQSPVTALSYTPQSTVAIAKTSTPIDPATSSELQEDDSVSNADSNLPPALPTNPSDAWQNLRDLSTHGESRSLGLKSSKYPGNGQSNNTNGSGILAKGIQSYRLVREKRLDPYMVSMLVSHYYDNYHAYLPLVPRNLFDASNMDSFAAENKHLLTAVLTIASKDWVDQESYLHECCSRYMHDLISGIAAGSDCGVEAVEALLLLAEWEPRGLGDRVEAVGKGEEDRAAWMHVGTALRVGNFLGLERTSFRHEPTEDESSHARKRLAWTSCYISDRLISLRIGKGFWARGPGPISRFGEKDFPSLQPLKPEEEDYARILQANLDLTQLYSNVHDVLYTGLRSSTNMMIRGDYVKHIDDFRTSISHWHNKWGDLDCSPHLKATLQMSYEYLCLYTNAFAFQAAITQAVEKKSEGSPRDYIRTIFSNVGMMPDARFIFESIRAAKNYLMVLNNNVDPEKHLRYMPVRFFLYTIYSAVFLFKARSFGAIKSEEEKEIRQAIHRSVSLLKKASIHFQDPGSRYSQLLERLWQRLKASQPTVSGNTSTRWPALSSGLTSATTTAYASPSAPMSDTSSQMNFSPGDMIPSWLDLPQIGNYVDSSFYAPMPGNTMQSTTSFPHNNAAFYPSDYGVQNYDVRYAAHEVNTSKSAKSRGSYLRVSFKNTRETAQAINGWKLQRAVRYLENVMEKKEAVPMRRYAGSTGRTAQGKQFGVSKARWPVKSAEFLLSLLKNAEANADAKGLDTGNLIVKHIQVNQAPKQRRRTYRAHGRINPYMSNPCHIELILTEGEEVVQKGPEVAVREQGRLNARQRGSRVRRAITEG